MDKNEVRQILGVENFTEEFRRTEESTTSTDAFNLLGIFVYYDDEDKCDSLEFFDPAQVIFNGLNLLDTSFNEFMNAIKEYDENIEEDDSGCTSYALGIGAYAPFKEKAPDEKNEGIIIFKKGYYGG